MSKDVIVLECAEAPRKLIPIPLASVHVICVKKSVNKKEKFVRRKELDFLRQQQQGIQLSIYPHQIPQNEHAATPVISLSYT